MISVGSFSLQPEFSENMSIQWGSAFLQFHLSWICWGCNRLVWPRLQLYFFVWYKRSQLPGARAYQSYCVIRVCLGIADSEEKPRCKSNLPSATIYIYIYIYIYVYIYMYTMECYFQRVIWDRFSEMFWALYLLESFCITFCTATGELPPQLSTVIPLDWDSVWTTLKADGRGSHVAVMFDVIVLAEVSALTEPNSEFGSRLFNFLIGVWQWRLWLGKSILSTYANMLFDLARHWSTTRHFAAVPQAAGVGFGKILHHTWEFSFLASLCHQSVSKAHGLKVSPNYP